MPYISKLFPTATSPLKVDNTIKNVADKIVNSNQIRVLCQTLNRIFINTLPAKSKYQSSLVLISIFLIVSQ